MTSTHARDLEPVDGPEPTGGEATAGTDRTGSGLRRRTFLGYVMAGSTLVVAADMGLRPERAAAEPIGSAPQVPEAYDLEDLQTDSARPTEQLISVTINEDGTASFAIPRTEVGQGILTSTAIILAEELDLPIDKVKVSLAKARPELLLNQLTGGSNTTFSTYTPIRVAGAIAKQKLLEAAAIRLETDTDRLTATGGIISDLGGNQVTYGELATEAATQVVEAVQVALRPRGDFKVIGKPQRRTDALAAVTGQKEFTLDLDVPGALPTMVCRAPTHMGKPKRLKNASAIKKMPGVTHVAQVDTGIAVRAKTFGQCIDAIREMDVDWLPGTVDGQSDQTVLAQLRAGEIPLAVPELPDIPGLPAGIKPKTIDTDFAFAFRSSASLEPYSAIADVREDKATIWAGLKVPILAQQNVAAATGLPQSAVTVNVVTGGGSFGHKLFGDHAIEAAKISKAMGVPVRLMWHRADEPRQGRLHPMATSRIRATIVGDKVATFEQRHTSVTTDFSHGLGEMITSQADELDPIGLGGLSFAESIFTLTQELPYNFGVVDQLLNEPLQFEDRFSTGSMRNIYSPDVAVAAELTIDKIAKTMGKDPLAFRKEFLKNERVKAVLDKAAEEGRWGRRMAPGTAQGIAIHKEYKGATAVMVEIDCRPQTVNRKIREAVTGPRVTKVVVAVDAGLVINPTGLEAQMQGGAMDGIALTLTSSCHLRDGHFLEASWDNYFYTRQWNVPPAVEVHIVESDSETPGGAGEAAVGSTAAAVACAYARATGKTPTFFPINHGTISFKPKSFVPPVPPSPTNGLKLTR